MPGELWDVAQKLRDDLDGLHAQLDVAERRAERSVLNNRIHALKDMLRWCETRVGYVPPGE